MAGAIVSEPQKDFFHPRESYSRAMRRSNSHFNQLPGHYGCYGVPLLRCNIHFEQLRRCFGCYVPTAISINFQHAMDATLQHPFRATWKTLWMLRFQQPFQSTSSTLWMLRCKHPFRATWKTPRMLCSNSHLNQLPGHYGCYGLPLLRCNIHFEQLRRRFGCYLPRAISINFQDSMDARL